MDKETFSVVGLFDTAQQLMDAIHDFGNRERRYGGRLKKDSGQPYVG